MKVIIFLMFLVLLATAGCVSSRSSARSFFMQMNSHRDSALIRDYLDINIFSGGGKTLRDTLVDGSEVEMIDFDPKISDSDRTFYVTVTPPKPAFYTYTQQYYADGKIKSRGKLISGISIGMWEDYDGQGNKTIVNEDEQYGKFTYTDAVMLMHRKGLINVKTGWHRERLWLYYNKEEKYWIVELRGTQEEDVRICYRIDGETGKILERKKTRWTGYK